METGKHGKELFADLFKGIKKYLSGVDNMVKKIVQKLKHYEVVMAIKEIEGWENTGILRQQGIVKKIHTEYEKITGIEQSLGETEKAILLEAAKRFVRILK